MAWSTLAISEKALLIYEPPIAARSGVLFLLDESPPPFLDPDFRSFVEASPYLWFFAFPEKSWWSSRFVPGFHSNRTPEGFILGDCLEEFRKRLLGGSILLAGVGCGGQAVLRCCFQDPTRFPAVAVIDAAVDLFEVYGQGFTLDSIYPSQEHLRQQSPYLFLQNYPYPESVWLAVSPDSFWHRGNDRLLEKLKVLGVSCEYELFSGLPSEVGWFQKPLKDSFEKFLDHHLSQPARLHLL
jgi:pimeloyl-ACP methyl ester carboxylesterase